MTSSAIRQIIDLGAPPWPTLDPFLFCVYHQDFYPSGNGQMGPQASLAGRNIGQDFAGLDGWRMYHGEKVPGFPGHPHRGFETITVVEKGLVDHADSMGAAGRYGGGDVQWMTAGAGVQHSEMFPLLDQSKPNSLELFQIWLNLPRANKMANPYFTMFWNEEIPIYQTQDSQGKAITVKIVAGSLGDVQPLAPPPDSWAAKSEHQVAVWIIELAAEAQWQLPTAAIGVNRMVYVYESEGMRFEEQDVKVNQGIELDASLPCPLKNGSGISKLLVLQGKPIQEPVVQYGPFVMNSKHEIMQAFEDYQQTQFGGWPWPVHEQVHASDKGRFALYANGKIEEK